jgi:hypothetical protein
MRAKHRGCPPRLCAEIRRAWWLHADLGRRPPRAHSSRAAAGRSRIEWKKKMLKFIFQKMLINISMKMLVKRFGKNVELNIFFKQILVQLFPKMFNFL